LLNSLTKLFTVAILKMSNKVKISEPTNIITVTKLLTVTQDCG